MKKRILSVFMAMCLVLTLLPVSALAVGEESVETSPPAENVLNNEDGNEENGEPGENDENDETGTDQTEPDGSEDSDPVELVLGSETQGSATLTGSYDVNDPNVSHTWEVTSGEGIVSVVPVEDAPWTATVTALAAGIATVTHTWTGEDTEDGEIMLSGASGSEDFTVTVTEPEPEEPASDLTLGVGEVNTLKGGQPGAGETPEWDVTDGGDFIRLVPDTAAPWNAMVIGLAAGTATVNYSYGGFSRDYTVTVTDSGVTVNVKDVDELVVGGSKKPLLTGQGEGEDGHAWALSEGGDQYVSLGLYEGESAHCAKLEGIAKGTAILTHTWGDRTDVEVYIITVEGVTVADALDQISAQLADDAKLLEGMTSLDADFTLEKWKYSEWSGVKSWKIDTSFASIPLEATLAPGGEAVQLTPVDPEDERLSSYESTPWTEALVVRFDDQDGEGYLESEDTVCFRVRPGEIKFYYMDFDATSPTLNEVPADELAEATLITISGEVAPSTDPVARNQDTGAAYTTLQEALDEAQDGDTIVLLESLTDVAVTVTVPNLTLDLGGHTLSGKEHPKPEEGGSSSTDPQPSTGTTPAAITIGSNDTVDNLGVFGSFTLKNGMVSVGTGLRLYNELKDLIVDGVTFRNNEFNSTAMGGGAAVDWSDAGMKTPVEGSSATFTDCNFLNNSVYYAGNGSSEGGAVKMTYIETVSFTDCTFTENESHCGAKISAGGAVYFDACGQVSFDKCIFTKNSTDLSGGAVYMSNIGTANFETCSFTENKSDLGYGGAVAFLSSGSKEAPVRISNCTFTENTAAGGGAMALGLAGGSAPTFASLTGNTISNNTATSTGGAVYVTANATVTLTGNLTDNKASSGGAVYTTWGYYYPDKINRVVGIPSVIINGDITGNQADNSGGAVYGNIANITVNGTVTGNTAAYGGGIYSSNGAPASWPSTVDLTNASVYNNTAETAGADIYHTGGTLTISPVGENWILDSCGHMIDGWYADAADARWDADGDKLHVTSVTAGTITEPAALIAAHGPDAVAARTVTITPANIVVYTGGTGYGGVTDGDGNIIENTVTSGLPEPGYHLALSADLVDMLPGGAVAADDLSTMLRFQYTDEATGAVTRNWGLEYVGIYELNGETPESYVYSLTPATVGDEEIPVRILYFVDTNGNGKHDAGEYVPPNDDFTMDADTVANTYAMVINPGDLDQSKIQAVLKVGEEEILCKVKIGTGELTVKSTTNEEYRNEIGTVDDDRISATAAGVTYYVNDSEVAIEDPSRVQLLVDSVSNNDDFNTSMVRDAIGHADAQDGVSLSNAWAEAFYLDLVDTLNGNAVVTMGEEQKLTIYWPMPDGADEDGEFYIVHYDDMDRTAASGLQNDPEIIDVDVTSDGDHLTFQVGSFSPFVLVYERERSSGGSSRPSRPTLNTEDHYSYIIGYSDGTLQPYGTITRGEVATIFFRLLTDDSREEYWSQVNDYTDCSSDLWCNNAISTLTNMGIIDGFSDGTFRPYAKITRAQFAKIAVGFFETTREDYQGYFTDVDIDAWYTEYVEAAARVGLIEGFNDGTFRPNTNITRAQACVIVNRALGRAPDEDRLLDEDEMITWPDNNPDDWFYADMQEATNSHDYTWVTVSGDKVENWTDKLPQRDWAALEHAWSTAHSAPGGEVTE